MISYTVLDFRIIAVDDILGNGIDILILGIENLTLQCQRQLSDAGCGNSDWIFLSKTQFFEFVYIS